MKTAVIRAFDLFVSEVVADVATGPVREPGSWPYELRRLLRPMAVCAAGIIVAAAPSRADSGVVFAWGDNSLQQCALPGSTRGAVVSITCGYRHALALRAGGVVAWGYNGNGECNVPESTSTGVSAISAGDRHSLALASGTVIAWGSNDRGQCSVPTAALSNVQTIAAGSEHSIAVSAGRVAVWGNNAYQQCELPSAALSGVTAVAGGGQFVAAIKNGGVLAWGEGVHGQCAVPSDAESGIGLVVCGGWHTVCLKAGRVLAWGYNGWGQCDVPESAQTGVSAIAAGQGHTLALKNGQVLAWGRNQGLQCEPPPGLGQVTAIAGGQAFSLALVNQASILGVQPISGPSVGGTEVVINGTNFESPAVVTFGGAPATNVAVLSTTQIRATTPAGFPGPAAVSVNGSSSVAFYYRPECGSDLDQNGFVDAGDIAIILLDFGQCYQTPLASPTPDVPPLLEAQPATEPSRRR